MTRFRYGSIIESAFRIDENPYDKRIYVLKGKHARGLKLFENTVSIPRTCVSLCTAFLCICACEYVYCVYIIAYVSFPYTTFKPVPGAVLSTGLPRVPRRTRHIHSTHTLRYTLYMTYIHRGLVRKGFWCMSFHLGVYNRDPIIRHIRILISRCFVHTYIILYNENECFECIYWQLENILDIIAPESHTVSLGTQLD